MSNIQQNHEILYVKYDAIILFFLGEENDVASNYYYVVCSMNSNYYNIAASVQVDLLLMMSADFILCVFKCFSRSKPNWCVE